MQQIWARAVCRAARLGCPVHCSLQLCLGVLSVGSITARLDSLPCRPVHNIRRPHLGATKGTHHLPPFTI